MDYLKIKGARENNLKNVDLVLPKNKLIVMTGVSGSGKTSLAFDTIFKEGQRRYVESLSSYARQFLGNVNKPDVDSIEGLSPSISIDQKTTSRNPRSTVGTVTEIYDYFRLLYARIGVPYCPTHNIPITKQTIKEMTDRVLENEDSKVIIMAPIIRGKKGTHEKELEKLVREGFTRVRINGEMYSLDDNITLSKTQKHNIEVVVDRVKSKEDYRSRIYEAFEVACKKADGLAIALIDDKEVLFSENFSCPHCGFHISALEPRLFSFNSPFGACPECGGIGFKSHIDPALLIKSPEKSIAGGALSSWGGEDSMSMLELINTCKNLGIDINTPFKDLTEEEKNVIFYGTDEKFLFNYQSKHSSYKHSMVKSFEGVIKNLERRYLETKSRFIREWLQMYMVEDECQMCHGKRLSEEALSVRINGLNIYDLSNYSIDKLALFFENIKLNNTERKIADQLIKEISVRLNFLKNVGLGYLTLNRMAGTLSGGEAQRIRLATQIGSKLSGILYVLDEPSIGLHQSDNMKLINSLKEMRDLGNTLIVVEHDEETMENSDYIVDVGPKAGVNGGEIVFAGTYEEILKCEESITGKYLSHKLFISLPEKRRKPERGYLSIIGAKENNLKEVNVDIPIGLLTVVTGVSGSGKSSLINEVLGKNLRKYLYNTKERAGAVKEIKNMDLFDKFINIDQSPIGRNPRSNPATYIGVFDDIRSLFEKTNEAKLRGYTKSRFSFNVKGGRCEACGGDGVMRIEMNFLPDVYVECDECHGLRYNNETLEVKYKGKNIAEVLNMTVYEALDFFKNVPKIYNKLKVINDVGLDYIKLGQSSTTLSGGEAQRVKLASELYKKISPNALYILDEPTTGLHTDDIKKLLNIINKIVEEGATVIIIEHNLEVIKMADYIVDLGPVGGDDGGYIQATGTPEEIASIKDNLTGIYLKKVLDRERR